MDTSTDKTPAKIPVCIAMPPELRERIDAAATAADRSRSWIAATAIREFLDRAEKSA